MKPILFNTDMVRAILDGRKTVTRRVVKPQPRAIYYDAKVYDDDGLYVVAENQNGKLEQITLPYRPGNILYVRETWRSISAWSGSYTGCRIEYKVGGVQIFDKVIALPTQKGEWHPSIHMPREAARIFLRVKDVRVERLQEINDDGVISEGMEIGAPFDDLWDSTIKKADRTLYGWEANPWVWVISFERISREEAE